MKNITLAVDDDLLARYRVLAAEQRTSVDALIRKHMAEATGLAERRRQAREWMRQKALENMANDATRATAREAGQEVHEQAWRWSREETYAERQWPKGVETLYRRPQ